MLKCTIDYRKRMFGQMNWYKALSEPKRPRGVVTSAWDEFKEPISQRRHHIVNTTLEWTHQSNLGIWEHYRKRFDAVSPKSLTVETAESGKDPSTVTSSLWQILFEPFVALYLERGLGWTVCDHEPPGHKDKNGNVCKGDWLATSRTGREVFVETTVTSDAVFRDPNTNYVSRFSNVLEGKDAQVSRRLPTLVVIRDFLKYNVNSFHDGADDDEWWELTSALHHKSSPPKWNNNLKHIGAVLYLNWDGVSPLTSRLYLNPQPAEHARIEISELNGVAGDMIESCVWAN